MAAPSDNHSPISAKKLKRFIERLSTDQSFRDHLRTKSREEGGKIEHIHSIDPEFPGSLSQYYAGLKYLLHDPRFKTLYEQNYSSLSNPDRLADVCAAISHQSEVMGE